MPAIHPASVVVAPVPARGVRPAPSAAVQGVRLSLSWHLPRCAVSISPARHLLDHVLVLLHVDGTTRFEIAVMLSEACSNAVQHADGSEYRVNVGLDGQRCCIEVIDTGPGLRHGVPAKPDVLTERGHGLALIRAYSDHVELRPTRPGGLTVTMTKHLRRHDGAAVYGTSEDGHGDGHHAVE